MPVNIQATLICDDIRVEQSGKLILIGVYTPNIIVPQIPFMFPALAFFQLWYADTSAKFPLYARLRHTESGAVIAEATGLVTISQAGQGIGILRINNLLFDRLGTFDLIVTIDRQQEPVGIHSFEVGLRPVTRKG